MKSERRYIPIIYLMIYNIHRRSSSLRKPKVHILIDDINIWIAGNTVGIKYYLILEACIDYPLEEEYKYYWYVFGKGILI